MDGADIEPAHKANRYKRVISEAEDLIDDKRLELKVKKKLEKILAGKDPTSGLVDIKKLEKVLRNESGFELWLDRKDQGIPGIIEQVRKGRIGMSNQPGLDFVGDKEFYIYLPALIEHYLGEKPILNNIESGVFYKVDSKGRVVLDEEALDKAFKDAKNRVIKGFDGRGGDAVWVGRKTTAAELKKVKERVRKDFTSFKWQSYLDLSHMDGYIVDTRIISDVSGKRKGKVIVSNVSWGRGVPMSGNGKVNISDKGLETTILIYRSQYGEARLIATKPLKVAQGAIGGSCIKKAKRFPRIKK